MESLQQETQELTPEEQEERIKKEKIKIALEKMKAASVQKLVVKVFDDNLETSKTLAIDQLWTVRDVVSKMVKKNDVEVDPNWSLIERLPDMHLGMDTFSLSYGLSFMRYQQLLSPKLRIFLFLKSCLLLIIY